MGRVLTNRGTRRSRCCNDHNTSGVTAPSRILGVYVAAAILAACAPPPPHVPKPAAPTPGGRVLVVANERSAASIAVAEYYMRMREVPPTNLVVVDVDSSDQIWEFEFNRRILGPVREAIERLPQRIDFVLLTTGIPLRLNNRRGYSVDAMLAGMRLAITPMIGADTAWMRRNRNPYYNANEPFNSDKYSMYLVTRLDCARTSDCFALVDRAMAAQPYRGPFYFDAAHGVREPTDGYSMMDMLLHVAHDRLTHLGAWSLLDSTRDFVAPQAPLAGYVSWGSNDVRFSDSVYHSIRFLPGALAETFVSTSARTFKPTNGGQSRIVDLIEQGVTGVKGYVSEPYTIALANPAILFDRYLRGFTLAESFYAASRMVVWKDLVIGDPLCAPYAQFRTSPPLAERH